MATTKITFLDSDLACLFSKIDSTKFTCVNTAIFLQTIDYLIRKSGKKSILITAPELHEKYFPYWGLTCTKRNLQRLRELGVLRTQVEHKGLEHKTRIWIDNKAIIRLAKQVQKKDEVKTMCRRFNGE